MGWVVLSRKPAISLKGGKIGPRLLLMTYRKSHTRFRLMPKSTTLDNLEGPLRTVFKTACVNFGAHRENLNEDRRHCLRRRCSPMTLDSDNIRFMWIFTGVPWEGDVIQQWGNRKRVFFSLSDATYSAP